MATAQTPRIETGQSNVQDDSSDDHFSSASEGASESHSPIPITRVERIDDSAAHGEVPGTLAYQLRTSDAVPDEVEVVPDGQQSRSRSNTRSRALSQVSYSSSRPQTPGGSPIPRTVVDRIDDKPAHGEVEGTVAKEMRAADAEPDEVRHVDDVPAVGFEGRERFGSIGPEARWDSSPVGDQGIDDPGEAEADDEGEEDDGFGDDFDEFAEGSGDDDFGDFDEGEEAVIEQDTSFIKQHSPAADFLADLPSIDFASCETHDDIDEAIAPYISAMFPDSEPIPSNLQRLSLDPSSMSPFLSERSLSLWQQLVSPPPMQPPNWTRSKIRRLFLVSLGVPVDLDEILPPSKQKRLVLPNVNFDRSNTRSSHAVERLKEQGANDSSTSVDSKGQPKPSKTRRTATIKGPPPPPDFDANAAILLCTTTEEALSGLTDEELTQHVATLQELNSNASRVLEYWLQRKDEGLREKEALEGVIENLVGFVKGRRGK